MSRKRVVIVIEKGSKQIRNNKSLYKSPIKLATYSFYDIYNPGPVLCHEVENIQVFCTNEKGDLRFTDENMGNEIYIN